jgi:hypothetical protein
VIRKIKIRLRRFTSLDYLLTPKPLIYVQREDILFILTVAHPKRCVINDVSLGW